MIDRPAPAWDIVLRTRDTSTRSDVSTDGGGSPSHNASISRSDGTTRPDCRASRTNSPRSLPAEISTGRPRLITSSGPITRTTTDMTTSLTAPDHLAGSEPTQPQQLRYITTTHCFHAHSGAAECRDGKLEMIAHVVE